jgi:type III secretion protein R
VVYGVATVMTLVVMTPVLNQSSGLIKEGGRWPQTSTEMIDRMPTASSPLKGFMARNINPQYHQSMLETATKFQKQYGGPIVTANDFMVILPAFVISELSAAFKIGVALFLPFVVIDMVVSIILMALGMMMVSPQTITTPLKVIAFVAVDGWSLLLDGLMLSYLS